MCSMPATEPTIAIQVKRDALKEMTQVEQAETAPFEHLDLVIQAFHKATRLSLVKVVPNQVQPGVQQREEWVETSYPARFHLLPPPLDLLDALRFRAGSVKDRGERLAQLIRLAQARHLLKEARETLLLVGFQISPPLAKGPPGVFDLVGLLLRKFLAQPLQFLFAERVGTVAIVLGHMEAINHNAGVGEHLAHSGDIRLPHIRADSADLVPDLRRHGLEPGDKRGLGPIRQDRQDDEALARQPRRHNHHKLRWPFFSAISSNPRI